jgi:predicted kinase
MPTLFVMSGLSFSGKTTLARKISQATGAPIVSYDELFATTERDASVSGLDEWYLITGLVDGHARAHLAAGRSVIVDTLNEDRIDRDRLRAIAAEHGAEAIVVHVDAPRALIEARRRENEITGVRGTTADESFEFVLSRFEPPAPAERSIRYQAGDDVEEWLRRLLELVAV